MLNINYVAFCQNSYRLSISIPSENVRKPLVQVILPKMSLTIFLLYPNVSCCFTREPHTSWPLAPTAHPCIIFREKLIRLLTLLQNGFCPLWFHRCVVLFVHTASLFITSTTITFVSFGCLCFLAPGLLLGLRPRSLALAPNLYFYRPWPPSCIYRPWPPPCVYPKFVFTGSAWGLSLHIPTLSPQFVFTGPGLRFVRTQAAKLIYPQ